jgi:hypothetical protein
MHLRLGTRIAKVARWHETGRGGRPVSRALGTTAVSPWGFGGFADGEEMDAVRERAAPES